MQHCNCKIKILFWLLLLIPGLWLHAQLDVFTGDKGNDSSYVRPNRSLISTTVDTSGNISKFGPNRLFFMHVFGQLGVMPLPQIYGSQTNWWSWSFAYGVRSKLKLFYWNAIVLDATYRYDRFGIRQNTVKLTPLTTERHVRERISLHNFSVTACDRINFRRRGNVLGIWLDLGVYADNILRSTNVFLDEHYDSNSTTGYHYKTKTTIARLAYIEKINYGFTVRTGGEFTSFFIQYRMNKLFSVDTPNNRDLPNIIFGIGFAGWD